MESLTLQALLNEAWVDIAEISFPESDNGNWRLTELDYLSDYAIEHLDADNHCAASINHPVALYFDDHRSPGWLRFIDDIIPSGASRRYWVNQLDLDGLTPQQQDFILLKYGTISPVGNLRIKESLPDYQPEAESIYFTVQDVVNRAADFLDYAQLRGAAAGGATGAGGEAPKLLLRCSADEQIWIDSWQNSLDNTDSYYLVKYPRGGRTEIDCHILRAEYHFYHELTAMGFNTIPTKGMRLEEGTHYPSLWLPRFDIQKAETGKMKRYAMESVYSMLQKPPGTLLDHETTIRQLLQKIENSNTVQASGERFHKEQFVIEWVRRDLLNIVFGNSDNHGRNTAFMRDENHIRLAPIYDFAPMKADPEGIPRSTKWASPLEIGGQYNFPAIADTLSDLVPAPELLSALRETAASLVDLPERLQARGVPEAILLMPSIGFKFMTDKLTRWGLL